MTNIAFEHGPFIIVDLHIENGGSFHSYDSSPEGKTHNSLMFFLLIWLVVSTPLKNMKVSWDDYSQYMEENVPDHQPYNSLMVFLLMIP